MDSQLPKVIEISMISEVMAEPVRQAMLPVRYPRVLSICTAQKMPM